MPIGTVAHRYSTCRYSNRYINSMVGADVPKTHKRSSGGAASAVLRTLEMTETLLAYRSCFLLNLSYLTSQCSLLAIKKAHKKCS